MERINQLRFFIAGAEAVMGDIGNGEECLDALQTIEGDLASIATLRGTVEKLHTELKAASTITKEKLDQLYKAGHDDAMAETRQERAFAVTRQNMLSMLAHRYVSLCTKAGHAPFGFKPQYIMRYDGYCNILDVQDDPSIHAPDTVGIVGTNTVTLALVFITDFDHWHLAKEP